MSSKLAQGLQSLKTVAKNVATGQDVLVDEETFNKRMAKCQGCECHNKTLNQCTNCGCFLSVKGKLAGMKCPLGKWEK